ncbi:B12-binding domain-containing radical SAM protein [Verrucomicrobiaceae bacterium N1E253]|uniref:B12-binding domain-containing radical SAM protein n=1 Tax=Oceaniferula marina TaxID=2748318 RepID=A0A851GFJ6_9BACT|nr:radical SAM protein [Oceaniferula marina]NWK55682.1 B12-binding domain-containing radical SAM protein [Oceaniferula marina]
MKFKFILPSLTEAESPFWRPIKYSLFPPLGLATLASYLPPEYEAEIIDQHVQALSLDDRPDVVAIQVYITNAYRAYQIADHYRNKGCYVILGGLHVTSLPDEAQQHADTIILGPAEEAFPRFLEDLKNNQPRERYFSNKRTLNNTPPTRRELIDRKRYLVPNSIVVTRGCPHHCDFCYKDAFYRGGKSFYTQQLDDALQEIERLPGRHLYFLDDHLLGNKRFARDLFNNMKGMNRIFQGAATVNSILDGDLIDLAAEAGLRSVFVGFESLNPNNLKQSNKKQNLGRDYKRLTNRLHDLGIMINGSFVFGLDDDDPNVFQHTVDWAIEAGITTSTFHIATPYPGTAFYQKMEQSKRMLTHNWDLFDTRHATYQPMKMSCPQLEQGYRQSYREFYRWSAITRASLFHGSAKHQLKHFFYTSGWKKFEPLWNLAIQMKKLNLMTPLLETVLAKVTPRQAPASTRPITITSPSTP